MPRPRTNDPLGVFDNPSPITDDALLAQAVAQYRAAFRRIMTSYSAVRAMQAELDLNKSIAGLQALVSAKNGSGHRQVHLHPFLRLAIADRARQLGDLPLTTVLTKDHEPLLAKAAREVAKKSRAIAHRPDDAVLSYHVEALMVLIQQFVGVPIVPRKIKGLEYHPHFADAGGQMIQNLFAKVDPSVTVTALVNVVLVIRKKLAGQPLDFARRFPFFAGDVDFERGVIVMGKREVKFKFYPGSPAYCS